MKPEEIKTEFRRRQLLLLGISFLFILCGAATIYGNSEQLFWLFLPITIVYVITCIVYWRCPACNAYLGRNAFPSRCPNCEQALR